MLSEEDIKEIEKAKSNILRGNDIESASLILEKVIWNNLIIVSGRVDIIKVAVRQILNFIEEYKDKGYLDVVKEKVKANEELTKLQKENEDLQREKEENKLIIAMANNEMLGYNQGYLDGKNQNSNATEIIIKNRQAYMHKEEVEFYKRKIEFLKKENEEKDKQIDLMAEHIFQNIDVEEDICNSAYVDCKQETAQDITCINCIKQYFEKLAKKGE